MAIKINVLDSLIAIEIALDDFLIILIVQLLENVLLDVSFWAAVLHGQVLEFVVFVIELPIQNLLNAVVKLKNIYLKLGSFRPFVLSQVFFQAAAVGPL